MKALIGRGETGAEMGKNMVVRLKLLSDAVFGSGKSVPGGEDIGILTDEYGFPYISGKNIKGNLRETMENLLSWKGEDAGAADALFGLPERETMEGGDGQKIYVSDFMLPLSVRAAVVKELGIDTEEKRKAKREQVTELFTELRTFTRLEDGVSAEGSLRDARCVNEGLLFLGEITCPAGQEENVREALETLKWLGSMRSRGFGAVELTAGSCRETHKEVVRP